MQEPNVDEMLVALRRRAELRGKIKVLELEIKEAEIPIRKNNPRKPELRDEATIPLQREKVKYEVELEEVESSIEYLNFYTNIWKYTQFNVSKAVI